MNTTQKTWEGCDWFVEFSSFVAEMIAELTSPIYGLEGTHLLNLISASSQGLQSQAECKSNYLLRSFGQGRKKLIDISISQLEFLWKWNEKN